MVATFRLCKCSLFCCFRRVDLKTQKKVFVFNILMRPCATSSLSHSPGPLVQGRDFAKVAGGSGRSLHWVPVLAQPGDPGDPVWVSSCGVERVPAWSLDVGRASMPIGNPGACSGPSVVTEVVHPVCNVSLFLSSGLGGF